MSKILFHPQLTAAQAMDIAAGQGGRLVWRGNRQQLEQAQREIDRCGEAVTAGDYTAALGCIRSAGGALFCGSVLEVQP